MHFGWFVRYESDPTHLVRVPASIVRLVVTHHCADASIMPVYAASTLLVCQPSESVDFCARAAAQFLRLRARIADCDECEQTRERLKRKRHDIGADAADTREDADAWKTCIVCLEPSADAKARCAHKTCQAALCVSCHDLLRGLCPICDRGANDALYQCAACNQTRPLRRSGFPCSGCKRNTVCRECYRTYGACRSCL